MFLFSAICALWQYLIFHLQASQKGICEYNSEIYQKINAVLDCFHNQIQ